MATYCCTKFANVVINTNLWFAPRFGCGNFSLILDFQNDHSDATTALGAVTFTSSAHATIALCVADIVAQINAAATANPGGNPEGLTPASYSGGLFKMTAFPTPSLKSLCGDNLFCQFVGGPDSMACFPGGLGSSVSGNFSGGGLVCFAPPVIVGNPFVCKGVQTTVDINFPQGIPAIYTLTIPSGWTLVSKTTPNGYDLIVTMIPDSNGGIINVSYSNETYNYNVSFQFINDCFVAKCASKLLMDAFCHDTDPCCRECNEVKKEEKRVDNQMMNKAIGLITTYSLAKQKYFYDCNLSEIPSIQFLLDEIKSVLIRCNICEC